MFGRKMDYVTDGAARRLYQEAVPGRHFSDRGIKELTSAGSLFFLSLMKLTDKERLTADEFITSQHP
jgi:hypothetical protein